MTCEIENEDRERMVDQYLSGTLPPEKAREFEQHFFTCEECYQALQLREDIQTLVAEKGEELFARYLFSEENKNSLTEKLQGLIARLPQRRYTLVGIPALVTALILAIFLSNRVGQQVDPANFTPLPHLEAMVSDVSRSSDLNVVAPANGANLENTIQFEWQGGETISLTLKILDNRGVEIFSVVPEGHTYTLAKKLEPGRYYWKLETDEDLLYLGEFFVNKPD